MAKTKKHITTEEILFKNIVELINTSRKSVAKNINYTILFTYFHIGRHLIEDEQKGKKRAEYSKNILKNSATMLRNYEIIESSVFEFKQVYKLSWSHYILLLKIENEYERIALSKKERETHNILEQRKSISNPIEFLKEPYVLEFLELKEDVSYTENQLEEAIINKIEKFLMELGKGFLFDSRQKRISFDGDDFYIDLVFYNRLLKCFVIIDLKIGKLTHQDIGQLQMYVNYYDRKIKNKDENKTIGMILCKETNKAVVEFTPPEDNEQIFAREYKLYLPSKSDLQKLLQD